METSYSKIDVHVHQLHSAIDPSSLVNIVSMNNLKLYYKISWNLIE